MFSSHLTDPFENFFESILGSEIEKSENPFQGFEAQKCTNIKVKRKTNLIIGNKKDRFSKFPFLFRFEVVCSNDFLVNESDRKK